MNLKSSPEKMVVNLLRNQVVNLTGLCNLIKNSDITIYPNPSSTILHIKTDQYFDEATKIEIANSLGQVVMNIDYSAEIDVSLLNSGMYIIKLITPNKQQFHSNFVKME